MWRTWITRTLLMGKENGKAILERQFFERVNKQLPYYPVITLLGLHLREMKGQIHKILLVNVYSSFIRRSKNWNLPGCPSTGKWLNRLCPLASWNRAQQEKGTDSRSTQQPGEFPETDAEWKVI